MTTGGACARRTQARTNARDASSRCPLSSWPTAALISLLFCACGDVPVAAPTRTLLPAKAVTQPAPRAVATVPSELDAPPPQPTVSVARSAPGHPAIERLTLDSGLQVGVARVLGATQYSLSLIIEAGGLDDRPGVAELLAAHIVAGACSGFSRPRDFRRSLAKVGPVHTVVQAHRITLSLTVEPSELAAGLDHLSKSVARAEVTNGRFNHLRSSAMNLSDSWSRDDFPAVARELMTRTLLGNGESTSRRAVAGTRSEISRIRHAHVNAFYRAHVHALRSWLLVVGPASPTDLPTRIGSAFSALGKRSPRPSAPSSPRATALLGLPQDAPRRIFIIDTPKSPRVTTYAVRWMTKLDDKSFDLLDLLNAATTNATFSVLGPGAIAWSAHQASRDDAVSHAKTTMTALDALSVSAEQQQQAKLSMTTRIPLISANPTRLSSWLRAITAHGLPDDHGLRLGQRFAAVNAQRLKATIGKLTPTRMLIVFADADALKEPMRALGEVRIVDPRRGFAVRQALPSRLGR